MTIKVNQNWAAIPQGVFKTDLVQRKRAKAQAETHFHNYNFNLHIRQIQFRLETSHHGNQQMNCGQKVFAVDDWQANTREQNTHTHKNNLHWYSISKLANSQYGSKERPKGFESYKQMNT